MEFLLGIAALFFLSELLFPAKTDRGELMYDDYQEPAKAPRRVVLDEFGRPFMYVDGDAYATPRPTACHPISLIRLGEQFTGSL